MAAFGGVVIATQEPAWTVAEPDVILALQKQPRGTRDKPGSALRTDQRADWCHIELLSILQSPSHVMRHVCEPRSVLLPLSGT